MEQYTYHVEHIKLFRGNKWSTSQF